METPSQYSASGELDEKKQFNNAPVEVNISDTITPKEHEELIQTLKVTVEEHQLDPNFPADILSRARQFIEDDSENLDSTQLRNLVIEIENERKLFLDDSPYAEVRAVVDNTDDTSLPVNTIRVWFLGILFTIIGTGLDQFFSLRQPGLYISSFVAQLVAYPCGVAMATYLPKKRISLGPLGSFTLNPGPFNQKEHCLITVMSNVSYGGANGTAYVTYIFQVLKLSIFFDEKTLANSAGFQILLAFSTQLIGYGTAGLARRFLVYPQVMIWPKSLAQIALNRALHNDNGTAEVHGWRISRYRFFMYCFGGMFLYFWFPDYIFQALSYFNWMTWIAPTNLKLAIITGSICGLGLNPLPTFDWNVVSYLIDPIITPWFAVTNIFAGMFITGFIILPPMYFNNVWNSAYFPINSNYVYDNTGSQYNVSRVLNADFTLNEAEFEAYSPAYLGAANSLLYSAFFAIYLATIVYVGLYHRTEIIVGVKSMFKWKNARDEHNDVHNRLMAKYKEVPEWWYLSLLAISFIMACVACSHWDTGMPVWGIVFAIALCLVLQIPVGIIMGVTNVEVTNNVIAEFIGGYAIPNNPIANMIFKSFGYIACAQSVQFAQDLKMGHYLKVPPRSMFWAQTVATLFGALVSIGVNDWQLSNIEGICETGQSAKFTCPGSHTFFSAAVIWGVIGPKRIYGDGGIYHPLTYGFLVGALLPIPFYFLSKRFPNSWLRYVHVPVLLYGALEWAPYNLTYVWSPFVVGFFVNYYVKSRYIGWWQKYAYVLTSALASGMAVSAIIIFFAVQYKAVDINWWGNTVSYAGVDGGSFSCVLKEIPDVGHF